VVVLILHRRRLSYLVAAANDWQLPQEFPEGLPKFQTSLEKPYGFLCLHSGYLRHVGHTENEVNDLGPDAEKCSKDERSKRRIQREDDKWDPEHYMSVRSLLLPHFQIHPFS
jgi:protein SHQ1